MLEKNGYSMAPTENSVVMDNFDIVSPNFVPNTIYLLDVEERVGDFDFTEEDIGYWAREWNNDHYAINGELLCEEHISKFDESDGEFIEDEDEYKQHIQGSRGEKGFCFNCRYILVGLACLRFQRQLRSE